MNIPTKAQAHELLEEGQKLTPGPWGDHCRVTAQCAYAIASRCENLNAEHAYVLGLLHDIGYSKSVIQIKHTIEGYNFMKSMGYDFPARICLSHSFPINDIEFYTGKFNITSEEKSFLADYLANAQYDDYDRLIQLCDALATADGPCIVEQRLLDVAIRHGVKENSIEKWKKYLELKDYFNVKTGSNIYSLIGINYPAAETTGYRHG